MAIPKLPYVMWRDGRPRFQPSAREQRLGFRGQDLRHGQDGPWFTFEQAKVWAEARYAEILQARTAPRTKAIAAATAGGEDTVEGLLLAWLAALAAETDPDERLSPDGIESYRKAARAVIFKPETRAAAKLRRAKERAAQLLGQPAPERERELFALKPPAAVDDIELKAFYDYLKRARGHHMARAAVAAFSAAWTWGRAQRVWRPRLKSPDNPRAENPRHELTLGQPAGRIVIYSDAEIRALIAAGDAIGRPSVGDSIFLGLFTSQRQRDRLTLKDEGLVDGRRHFRQSKQRGKLVPVPDAPVLAARLAAARARVAAIALKLGSRPETIVVDEATGAPYVQRSYRTAFSDVRALAIQGSNQYALAPCPSLAGKRDADLRDTAVTWLARAGCTMAEICAITGHSPKSVQTIIEHYLGSQRELADAGIDKLVAWMAREGIAV